MPVKLHIINPSHSCYLQSAYSTPNEHYFRYRTLQLLCSGRNLPMALSLLSITASAPSRMALATSQDSAPRVKLTQATCHLWAFWHPKLPSCEWGKACPPWTQASRWRKPHTCQRPWCNGIPRHQEEFIVSPNGTVL